MTRPSHRVVIHFDCRPDQLERGRAVCAELGPERVVLEEEGGQSVTLYFSRLLDRLAVERALFAPKPPETP